MTNEEAEALAILLGWRRVQWNDKAWWQRDCTDNDNVRVAHAGASTDGFPLWRTQPNNLFVRAQTPQLAVQYDTTDTPGV